MMILWLLAYLGGTLTILSPCILPVLPFVLSRSNAPFRQSGLPLLAGMTLTFAGVATLAVVGGGWVVRANDYGRWGALVLLSFFAASLLFPSLSEWITRPFTRLGSSLQQSSGQETSASRSFVLGIATGFLWAPCAGPILGLILTSAAIKGANAGTTILLLMYALGAATSLALALLAGQKVYRAMKGYLGADEWVRRILGILVLGGVAAIALGLDRGTLTRLSRVKTETIEQKLVQLVHRENAPADAGDRTLPELTGATAWFNSPPLTRESLKGKVVLVDFWTYSCINCLRTLPYMKAWADKYKAAGLVIIGVHTPEFAFEKSEANVQKAIHDLGVTYPVALDAHYAIWNAFQNQYWPAHYFVDTKGRIRHTHFGEGEYEESERVIQTLLTEAGAPNVPGGFVRINADGTQAPVGDEDVDSPETYIGSARAQHQVKEGQALQLNQWILVGSWDQTPEHATLEKAGGKIVFRFHARDLHLVLGPGDQNKPVSFIVRIDGQAPGVNHGTDIDGDGRGYIQEERLYQLYRQKDDKDIRDRTFEIEFDRPGAQAFAFTFG